MTTMLALLKQKPLRICGWIAACAVAASALAAQTPAPRIQAGISSAEMSTLKGSAAAIAQPQFDAGRMPANTPLIGITLVFNRTAAQQADLEALLAAQQNPASPLFHQWLTPEQFGARFGMAQADIDRVTGWLQQQGFSIDSVARGRNSIRFSGNVGQVEQAFRTQMHYYKSNGVQHIAPSTVLSVPSAIAPAVEGVRNLSDFRPRSMRISASPDLALKARPAFTSSSSGNVFFSPGDIKTVYDFAPLTSTGINGAGQSIVIVGQSDVDLTDVENFQTAAGLAVKDPIKVLVPTTGSPAFISGDESESDLDLEWSGAMAPGATIYFVHTGNSTNNNGVFDSISYAVDQKLGNIISVSYGACESLLGGFSLESTFQQAAAQGQTVVSASGDQGSTACFQSPTTTNPTLAVQEALAVNYPASSPYVTGVGGTEIDQTNSAYYTAGQGYWIAQSSNDVISSAIKYMPEVAWNDDSPPTSNNPGGLSATGGGVSALFNKPTWQTGVPGIPADGKRDVPDISFFSSPNYVAYLYCSSDTSAWNTSILPYQQASCSGGTFRDTVSGGNWLTAAGGTSFATPIFAGMLALLGEAKGYTTGQGLINPTLYTLASNSTTYAAAFHDITSGNNYCTAGTTYCSTTSGSTTHYNTNAGYDPVTGLGSIDLGILAGASLGTGYWPAATTPLLGTTTTVSVSNATPLVNTNVTFTITVAPVTGTSTPTGTVNLSIDGGGTAYNNNGTTATVNLTANGTATYTTTFATSGVHTVVAQYAGSATYAASTGTASVTIEGPSFTLAANPATISVNAGSSGTSTITITSKLSYAGTVNFTLSTSSTSLQTNGCYTIANTPVTANGTATATLTLYTSQTACSSATTGAAQPGTRHLFVKTTASPASSAPAGQPSRKAIPIGAAALGGFLLLGLRKRRAKWLTLLGCFLLLGVASLAVGCGGGSSTSGGGSGTVAAGSHPFTLTGTDSVNSSITTDVSMTLTVN